MVRVHLSPPRHESGTKKGKRKSGKGQESCEAQMDMAILSPPAAGAAAIREPRGKGLKSQYLAERRKLKNQKGRD